MKYIYCADHIKRHLVHVSIEFATMYIIR